MGPWATSRQRKATEKISVSLAALIQILTSKGTEGGQHHSEMGPEKKADPKLWR